MSNVIRITFFNVIKKKTVLYSSVTRHLPSFRLSLDYCGNLKDSNSLLVVFE
jgi:hypothetical protein